VDTTSLGDAGWLAARLATLFTLDGQGRLVAGRDPADAPPRLFVQRSALALDIRLRHDLDPALAAQVMTLLDGEPPAPPPGPPLRALPALRQLFGEDAPQGGGPVYPLPHDHEFPLPLGAVISSGEPSGDPWLQHWRLHGLPAEVDALGFTGVDDVWPPWRMILVGGEVAAICQSARFTDAGCEAGVITAPRFRGRGLAAAVTAAWSAHPALKGRPLFYSTSAGNLSSQRVAARLGLAHRAQDFRFT
jgi:hypothetical protein